MNKPDDYGRSQYKNPDGFKWLALLRMNATKTHPIGHLWPTSMSNMQVGARRKTNTLAPKCNLVRHWPIKATRKSVTAQVATGKGWPPSWSPDPHQVSEQRYVHLQCLKEMPGMTLGASLSVFRCRNNAEQWECSRIGIWESDEDTERVGLLLSV